MDPYRYGKSHTGVEELVQVRKSLYRYGRTPYRCGGTCTGVKEHVQVWKTLHRCGRTL